MKYFSVFSIFFALSITSFLNANEIDLSGKWQVSLEQNHENTQPPTRGSGPTGNRTYHLTRLSDSAKQKGEINLPSTLDENGYGEPVLQADIGCLSRKVRFIGKAHYKRTFEVSVPIDAAQIVFERVMWGSKLKLDGKELGEQQSLATPHIYNIGHLTKGKHTLELCVDNSMQVRIGEKGHAYGEHMQTIWNGVLGEMKIQPIPLLQNVLIHAPGSCDAITVLFNTSNVAKSYTLTLTDLNTNKIVETAKIETIHCKDSQYKLVASLKNVKPWDEFTPQRYTLSIFNNDSNPLFTQNIGFRSLKREGNRMFLNGKPLFLRGNLDNCHFPLTGYPSLKVADWEHIFKISKENGLNQVRFHSYCPPVAAFEAADKLGVYLAPEANMWIDGWMPGDSKGKRYIGMGQGDSILDAFIKSELHSMINTYGNSPSFCMIGIGNECGNSNFNLMNQWMKDLKEKDHAFIDAKDQKRLYSLSTARQVMPIDDFTATHSYPGVGGTRQWMNSHTNWDYESQYSKTTTPCIAHEIGQWPVYPLFDEIENYTGVLRPWNLELIKKDAENKGVLTYNKLYNNASGNLNKLMYKDEIESFMRTPSCRGIHLLGMQDYSGQGEALIGWLNSFYENKGFWTPKEVRGCFSPVVTLARIPNYTLRNHQKFTATLQARNTTFSTIENAAITWNLLDTQGIIKSSGITVFKSLPPDEVITFGELNIALDSFIDNEKYTLQTYLVNAKNHAINEPNSWNFWIYDSKNVKPLDAINTDSLCITDSIELGLKSLKEGKNVLLYASSLGGKNKYASAPWGAVYWSTTWFPGQPTQTLGLAIDQQHKAFDSFTTDAYGNWQWRDLCQDARGFDLKDLNLSKAPIIMPVPDFHNNRKMGTLFELKVDSGKLLVCGYNLDNGRPQHRQLNLSLQKYIQSEHFNPVDTASSNWVKNTFEPFVDKKWNKPKAYEKALYYIECAKHLAEVNRDVKHAARYDYFDLGPNKNYEVKNITLWNDGNKSYWVIHKDAEITINLESVNPGTLLIDFADPNHNNRRGEGSFEGRPFEIKAHGGKIERVQLRIDREDCIDKKLIIKINPTSGPNLMIERIIYMPQS